MPRAAFVVVLAALIWPVATAAPRTPSKADLTVPSGSVSQTARLTGTFTVQNRGTKNTGTFRVVLKTRASGRDLSLKSFSVPSLRKGRSVTLDVGIPIPALPAGTYKLKVCVDSTAKIRERSESNNCASVGRFTIVAAAAKQPSPEAKPTPTPSAAPTPTPTPTPAPTPTPTPDPAPAPNPDPEPACDACEPLAYTIDGNDSGVRLTVTDSRSAGTYWVYVPRGYDKTHATPTRLLVWLHGCGGTSEYGIYTAADYYDDGTPYLVITPDGAERGCWDLSSAPARVNAAIADVKRHFRVDGRRVVLGGYSSGGDLSYRMAFTTPRAFAGVLAINTAPFKDIEIPQATALSTGTATSWRFHVLHVAHLQDETYSIDRVRSDLQAMRDAGWTNADLEAREFTGHHYDCSNGETNDQGADCYVPGQRGTNEAVQQELVPAMTLNWQAPAP